MLAWILYIVIANFMASRQKNYLTDNLLDFFSQESIASSCDTLIQIDVHQNFLFDS
jgi:hypothetical protein